MAEAAVVDLSSDDSNDGLPESVTIDGRVYDTRTLKERFIRYLEENEEYKDLVRQIEIRKKAQLIAVARIEELEKQMEENIEKSKRLGNPLDVVTSITGRAVWDEDEQCLKVEEPIQRIVVIKNGKVVREQLPENKQGNVDSGAESDSSDESDEVIPHRDVHEDEDVIPLAPSETQPTPTIPPPGKPAIFIPGINDFVFAASDNSDISCNWYFGRVESETSDHFVVTYRTRNYEDGVRIDKHLVVSAKTQPSRLEVPLRVVAAYRTDILSQERPPNSKAGFIAEPPSSYNKYQYLVFFDDGNIGYVPHEEIFPNFCETVSSAIDKIRKINVKYAKFLEHYFEQFPDRLLVKPVIRGRIIVLNEESSKKKEDWVSGKVKNVFASSVRIGIPKIRNSIWVYRGTYKLQIVHQELTKIGVFNQVQRKPKKPAASEGVSSKKSNDGPTYKPSRAGRNLKLAPMMRNLNLNRKKESAHVIQHAKANLSDSDSSDSSIILLDDIRPFKSVTLSDTIPNRRIFSRDPDISSFPLVFDLEKNSDDHGLIKVELIPYDGHQECQPSCLPLKYDESQKEIFRDRNPYTIPHIFGFRRRLNHLESHARKADKSIDSSVDVSYLTPCGRSIYSLEQMLAYLTDTDSDIPINYFAFDPELELKNSRRYIGCYYYDEDISKGMENVNISLVNEIEDSTPDPFTYMDCLTFSDKVDKNLIHLKPDFVSGMRDAYPFDQGFTTCCTCEDNCINPRKCECQQVTKDMSSIIYPVTDFVSTGYSQRKHEEIVFTAIYECSSGCPCKNRCPNRVVQNGIYNRLQVFKTKKTGWGIRALHDIPQGSFICEYIGKVLSPDEGNDGGFNDTYFADLDVISQMEDNKRRIAEHPEDFVGSDDDENYETIRMQLKLNAEKCRGLGEFMKDVEENTYVIDAIEQGNLGRFFNHSCEPNCVVQNVFFRTQDPRFPSIALFTTRTIKAFEELRWDYGYTVNSVVGRVLFCKCGSRNCKKRLL